MGRIFVFSGAGLSVESGIPAFRVGKDALWNGADPEIVCDYLTWKSHPEFDDQVHSFYDAGRKALKDIKPNIGHEIIADWSNKYGATLLTQNVDDLLERAGAHQGSVRHIHGFLPEVVCSGCGKITNIGYKSLKEAKVDHEHGCPGGRIKPNVVFFHEMAPEYITLDCIISGLTEEDTFIVVGTSFSVVQIDVFLASTPCRKILVDIADNSTIPHIWNEKYLEPATSGLVKLNSRLFQ